MLWFAIAFVALGAFVVILAVRDRRRAGRHPFLPPKVPRPHRTPPRRPPCVEIETAVLGEPPVLAVRTRVVGGRLDSGTGKIEKP